MIAVQKIGGGLTGCVQYVMGQGRDRETNKRNPVAANDELSRVDWIGGQGFEGWTPHNRDTADLARRVMEYDALTQASKTRHCTDDCFHLMLAWRVGEKPTCSIARHRLP